MTLVSQLQAGFTRVAQEINTLRTEKPSSKVWSGVATPNYVKDAIDFYVGAEDPIADGSTVAQGDLWLDPSDTGAMPHDAGSITFSPTGLVVLTGVTNVQAALAAADAALVSHNTRLTAVENRWKLIDDKVAMITSGNITLNTTAVTDVAGTQLTLVGAQAGDVVYYEISALLNAVAALKAFDAYTYVGGSRVNPFNVGLSASLAGVSGAGNWYTRSQVEEVNVGGRNRRVLVAGDITGGNVTVGLATAAPNTTARVLYANANNALQVSAQLWRPSS